MNETGGIRDFNVRLMADRVSTAGPSHQRTLSRLNSAAEP
jgi:hypothetical protein